MLTPEEVQKIARLARLELTAAEQEYYASTISAVLEYMNILNDVDTSGVEPTAQVTGLADITRPDKAITADNTAQLVASFSQSKNGRLLVPGVFTPDSAE